MSGFPPPPPGQGFPPPPPQGGGFPPPPGQQQPPPNHNGFSPPPNMHAPPGGGDFQAPPGGGGFQAAPPPGGGGFGAPGGRFGAPPPPAGGGYGAPPPPPAGGGFGAPPPPGGGGFQAAQPPPGAGGSQAQLNQGMANMSMGGFQQQQQLPPPGQPAPRKPTMFTPPAPQQGGYGGPPPPQGQGAPPAQTMFTPQAQGSFGGPPPPAAPQIMQPPGAPQQPGASNFYPSAPGQTPMQPGVAPAGPPGMQTAPGMGAPGMPGQFQESIDLSIQVPDRLLRFTAKVIPSSPNMVKASKVPLGGVVRPLAPAISEDEEVDTVQPGNAGIIRCRKCRTYINAFVSWVENGRRWRCNICNSLNECPSTYFCHLDENGFRRDKDQRPELSKGVVEFIAPAEYMVRPPQEPTYFFVIDVSETAVRSGMLHNAAAAIKRSLDDLPGRNRTKIGFLTYDNAVHYYNMAPDLSSPQMMVVSDLKELFVPLPDHLLVNLEESRQVVDSFLDSLPEMFSKNPVPGLSCLGSALKAAFTVMKNIGGKMCVFQSIMPNIGDGALRPRENQAIMGTPQEVKLLRPNTPWYKDTAVECSRQQISVDMFLFPYQYMDVSALSELPKFTAGTLQSYVGFNSERDGPRFEAELHKRLTQETGFEAVMRIRCTKGMRITNFYGNFFIRGTDLLALPNCTSDSVFGFDIEHDEQNISSSVVTVQSALLYTSSNGQRRIRVMTQALPITKSSSEFIASVDTETVCNLISKQALVMSTKTTLDNARMKMQQTCVDIIRAAKGGRTVSGYSVPPPGGAGGGEGETAIPENLNLLPLYTLAMMKNVAFRGGTDVHPDERIVAQYTLNSMSVKNGCNFIYPKMFSIHDMSESTGLPYEGNPDDDDIQVAGREGILLPQAVNLSCERLTNDGIFLLDNGVQMNLWVGSAADPSVLNSLFNITSFENVDMNQVKVNTSGDDFATRFGSLTMALREEDGEQHVIAPKIFVIREGDRHLESRLFWNLIEDRASFQGGTYNYAEFMDFVNNPHAAIPPGQGMPGVNQGMRRPGPPGQPGPPAGNYSAIPPQNRGPPPPGSQMGGGPPGPSMGAPPPGAYGVPPPGPPMGAPSPGNYGAPPGPQMGGPPAGNYSAPPGPQMGGPPAGNYGAPPGPQMGGPPAGNYGAPPPGQGPPSGNYGAPPPGPPMGGPSSGNYGAPPPGPPMGGPSSGNYGAPPPGPSYSQPPSNIAPHSQGAGNMPPPPHSGGPPMGVISPPPHSAPPAAQYGQPPHSAPPAAQYGQPPPVGPPSGGPPQMNGFSSPPGAPPQPPKGPMPPPPQYNY
eukprot:CAMPEP_0194158908 /NCGR_PEP_ID=MMETSP0152-20130528/77537_1 /TAXON_ID=1049557 /ORGANISM="Thalassiothrix antarctica, Strain L6-D1" /LENGTH=1308 /DNA_ID=CAMNT_0038868423 /DNA_START=117 /DNA_END=4043 /DNA_ORIENTATION=-